MFTIPFSLSAGGLGHGDEDKLAIFLTALIRSRFCEQYKADGLTLFVSGANRKINAQTEGRQGSHGSRNSARITKP